MSESKYYSIKELSELLKITTLTIHRAIKAKRLVAYKIGRDWRIAQSDLDTFLENGKNTK